MKNDGWYHFWQSYRNIEIKNDHDLLFQVGKTINGKVIDDKQFIKIINDVKKNLALDDDDKVLDLCCGNGILTYELAAKVKQVVGIDFSELYIQTAKKVKCKDNIQYYAYDINNLNQLNLERKFDKVLIYDALAYFSYHEIDVLLAWLINNTHSNAKILFASVLDEEKKWNFFNTRARKLNYFINIKLFKKTKGLGRWWKKKEFIELAKKHKLKLKVLEQNKLIHTNHYRVDVLLSK